jgi:adenosine deaminase
VEASGKKASARSDGKAGAGRRRMAGAAGDLPRGVFSELHLHLGGAILPNILYSYLRRQIGAGGGAGGNGSHPLLRRFPNHERFEQFFARKRSTLPDYLRMHTLVEEIQRSHSLRYFIQKLIRGAVLFDNLAYMELRYTPYFRTDAHLDEEQRIRQMEEIVLTIAEAAVSQPQYPLVFRQILCIHSKLPARVNRAILDLAIAHAPAKRTRGATANGTVVAVDIAGPDALYGPRIREIADLLKLARKRSLHTTGHVFETAQGLHPDLLPHLDRIGHGIQIPLRQPRLLKDLAKRGQCLEVCPTTYIRTGTLKSYDDLRVVLARCFDAGVPIAICTDNSGMHQVRLPMEFENLLVRDIIDFHQMEQCHKAAFQHAFGWEGAAREL